MRVVEICAERLEPNEMRGSWTYDNIVKAGTAIDVLNQARGMIQTRLREIGDEDHDLAVVLRCKRRELLKLRRSIIPHNPAEADAVTTIWEPLIKDATRFWDTVTRIDDMAESKDLPIPERDATSDRPAIDSSRRQDTWKLQTGAQADDANRSLSE
jgi:hypothetical protein